VAEVFRRLGRNWGRGGTGGIRETRSAAPWHSAAWHLPAISMSRRGRVGEVDQMTIGGIRLPMIPASCFFSLLAATMRSSSASGRCNLSASKAGAGIQMSISSGTVRMTGIAFGWNTPTILFGSVVRNAKISFIVAPSFTFRTGIHRFQMPARNA